MNEILRLLRIYIGMNGAEFADKLGISKSYLSEIEKGKKSPSLGLIRKYAEIYDTKPSTIMFLCDNAPSIKLIDYMKSKIIGVMVSIAKENEAKKENGF